MSPLRECLRKPVPEIEATAYLLLQAATAHLEGRQADVISLLNRANDKAVRDWTESLWGKGGEYAVKGPKRLDLEQVLSRDLKRLSRMPDPSVERLLHARDGFYCRFCGIPVIRKQVRDFLRSAYPEARLWGKTNQEQHAALQCMWVQYDHLLPYSRGGSHALENLVVTCAPCNYGRMDFTLEEAGLMPPLDRPRKVGAWNGLEHLLPPGRRMVLA